MLYPEDYNSAFAACPDPITFSSYTTIDIYQDRNAYYYDSDFKATERPGERDYYTGMCACAFAFEHLCVCVRVKATAHARMYEVHVEDEAV